MSSISAVVITFNEESNIGRCLESLKPVADEIIVLDSFSSDRTKDICEGYGVKFFSRAWEGYSASKNYANSLAKSDWILSLDADEALDEHLTKSILEVKKSEPDNIAFLFNRLTNYGGHWVRFCGWYPDKKIRMWRRGAGQWSGALHEKIIFSQEPKVSPLKGDVLHYSFPSIRDHVNTMNSFSEVAAQDIVKNKKRVSIVIHLLLNPAFTFVSKYFFRLGFLDGYYGFVICALSAVANFLKYSKALAFKKASRLQSSQVK